MRRRVFIGLALAAATITLSAAELPDEWTHWSRFREILLPTEADDSARSTALVRVAVPEGLFEEARSDLADLRVIDANGRDVGYVVFDRGRGPENPVR